MPQRLGATRVTRYVNMSPQVKRAVDGRLEAYIGHSAARIRDGIVQVLDEAGRTVSAPGAPPARQTGAYRNAWKSTDAIRDGSKLLAAVYNDLRVGFIPLWIVLEFGRSGARKSGRSRRGGAAAPRPHIEQGVNRALIEIRGTPLRRAA